MPSYTIADGQNETINAVYAPQNQFDYGNIGVAASGTATLIFSGSGQAYTSINLATGAHLTGTITGTALGTLSINGDASTLFTAVGTSNVSSADSTFNTPMDGTGTIQSSGHSISVNGAVGSGVTFAIKNGQVLSLNHPDTFAGTAEIDDAHLALNGLDRPTDYSYANGVATIYGGGDDHQLASFHLTDSTSNGPLNFYSNPNGLSGAITVEEGNGDNGDVALAHHVATQPTTPVVTNPPTGGSPGDYHTPASSAAAAFTETVSGAPGNQQGILYSGPVADLYYQLVVLTPGNINVTTHSPGCFVSTGAGNDAIALNSGTNVVDAGGGSNFLTSGSGFDTFFLDARNIPAVSSAAGPVPGAIWDTVQGFGHGDAVTLWGIGPGTALAWQKNEGAVGHTGLTLHANLANGSEASLTLAGIDNKASVALSYGSTGGASYLYVKAV